MNNREQAVQDLIRSLREAHPSSGGGFRIHPALAFARSAAHEEGSTGLGFGARVTEPVEAGEILLVIPESARLALRTTGERDDLAGRQLEPAAASGSSPKKMQLPQLLQQLQRQAEPILRHGESLFASSDFAMAVLVMYSVAVSSCIAREDPNNDGLFVKHAATWPSLEDTSQQYALYWGQPIVDLLKHTRAHELVTTVRAKTKEVFEEVLWPTLARNRVAHHFAPYQAAESASGEEDEKQRLWGAFLHAFSLVFSRSHGSEAPEILPLVDLFNGLPDACDDEINVALNGRLFRNDCNTTCSAVCATRRIRPGEALIISYGNVSPASFLLKYGVVPPQMLGKRNALADPVTIWYPPSMAPAQNDVPRIQALQRFGYPTTPEAIREEFAVVLSNESLVNSGSMVGGLGGPLIGDPHSPEEDMGLRQFRQYLILAKLLDDDGIQTNLRTGRLRGSFRTEDIGRLMVQIVDYNLNRIPSSADDEQSPASGSTKMAIRAARECHIEALARWRHIICRRYGLISWMDSPEDVEWSGLTVSTATPPTPPCLDGVGKGCPVCGRIMNSKTCSRCKRQKYCCREHQASDYKLFHKRFCKATR